MIIELDHTWVDSIRACVRAAEVHDGYRSTNETADLALSHLNPDRFIHLGAVDPKDPNALVAYGFADRRYGTAQMVVAPEHRRHGLGRAIVEAAARYSETPWQWWAFHNGEPAARLAEALELEPARQLGVMTLSNDHFVQLAPVPEGYRLCSYRDQFADELIDVNARAFAHHPEQGAMTIDDVESLRAQPWHRDENLIVALREDRLAGFHWTKISNSDGIYTGEVYVIGVDPAHAGHGLGRALLTYGIDQMRRAGVERIILYVEADNRRVVDIYARTGFTMVYIDVLYHQRRKAIHDAHSDR